MGVLACLLGLALIALPHAAPVFHAMFPELAQPVYTRISFAALTLAHLRLVALAGLISIGAGLALAIAVTRPAASLLRPAVQSVAVIGQTFPPVAVLAMAVPLLGYGAGPTVLALAIYGLLPVLAHTLAGIDGVPADVREAADAMGLGRWRRLREVELPLAAGPIMAGIRIAVIISTGTAALGSTVGANSLGSPIIEGLVGNNTAFVLQGVLVIGLLALLLDALLGLLEQRWRRHAGASA